MLIPRPIFGMHTICDTGSRYTLGGIKFDWCEETNVAQATDGRVMLAAWWSTPDPIAAAFNDAGVEATCNSTILAQADCQRAASLAVPLPRENRGNRPRGYVALDDPQDGEGIVDIVRCSAIEGGARQSHIDAESLEGRFPQVHDIWPELDGSHSIRVHGQQLRDLLDAMLAVQGDDAERNSVVLTLNAKASMLLITTTQNERWGDGRIAGVVAAAVEGPTAPEFDPREQPFPPPPR